MGRTGDTANIVPELLRAANSLADPGRADVRDLLHRAIIAIRDMRESVGIPGSGTRQDAIISLLEVAVRLEQHTDAAIRAALLEAADLIRTLRIVAESGVSLRLHMHEADPGA